MFLEHNVRINISPYHIAIKVHGETAYNMQTRPRIC